jgi:hypothetical protein
MFDHEPDERYISLEDAQKILRVTVRQVHRHVADGRIRSRKAGRHTQLAAADVEALAEQLGSAQRKPAVQEGEVLAENTEVMRYLREKDQHIMMLSRRVGELEGLLQVRMLPEDEAALRQELADARAETERFRQELEQARRPWWKRLLG